MVRHLEDGVVWAEVEVVAPGAVEVRRLIARHGGVGVALGAGAAAAGEAVLAAATGEEILVDDAVALVERLPVRVGGEAVAELLDVAGHLVAVVAGQGPVPLAGVELAAPDVEVRAADVREGDADNGGARLGIGNGVLADLERRADLGQDDCAAVLWHVSSRFWVLGVGFWSSATRNSTSCPVLPSPKSHRPSAYVSVKCEVDLGSAGAV